MSMEELEDIWGVALQTNSQELKETCFAFMRGNLEGLMVTRLFPLLEFASLTAILSDSTDEGVKFQAACSWVSHEDGRGRLEHTDELFSIIDLKNVSLNIIFQTNECQGAYQVRKAISDTLQKTSRYLLKDCCTTARSKPRGEDIVVAKPKIVLFGKKRGQFSVVEFDSETRKMGTKIDAPCLLQCQILNMADYFVQIGIDGKIVFIDTSNVTKQFRELILGYKKRDPAVAFSSHEIVVCGGIENRSFTSSCELHHYISSSMISLPNLLKTRSHGVAVWLPDGRLFVIGGIVKPSEDEWSCTVEMYTRPWNVDNPVRDQWIEATPMPTAVIGPSAARFRDRILVVGDKSAAVFVPPSLVDDSEPGQWTTLSCPYELTYVFGQDDRIFAIGRTSEIFTFEKLEGQDQTSEWPSFSFWNWKEIAYIECFDKIVGAKYQL